MVLEQENNDLYITPSIENMRKAGITVIENKEQLMEAIKEAEEDIKSGRVRPIDDVLRDIERKYGL